MRAAGSCQCLSPSKRKRSYSAFSGKWKYKWHLVLSFLTPLPHLIPSARRENRESSHPRTLWRKEAAWWLPRGTVREGTPLGTVQRGGVGTRRPSLIDRSQSLSVH